MKPTTLLLLIILTLLVQPYLPNSLQQFLYALSLSIKSIFIFILPFIIFSFLLRVILDLQLKAIGILLILFLLITLSNFTSIMLSYFVSLAFLPEVSMNYISTITSPLLPYWDLELPNLISNNIAILLSLVLGVVFIYTMPATGRKISNMLVNISMILLKKALIPVIPIFIVGFMVKMGYEKSTFYVFKNYSYLLVLIASTTLIYTLLWYASLTGKRFFTVLKNMFPPVLTGFSTMSSAVAMPVLIVATENNVGKSAVLSTIIPPVSSFHMVSDCILLSILSLGIYNTFYGEMPTFAHYLHLSFYLLIARFAMAGVPGGGAFVALPILKEHLHFTEEMGALLTTIYLIFDCINTALNVFANGAFIIGFKTLCNKILQRPI